AGEDRRRVPGARGVAPLRAGGRPLRCALRGRRPSAGGLRRAGGAHPVHGLPTLGEPDRVGGARDRQPPADRAARRDGARGRARVGAGLTRPATHDDLPNLGAFLARWAESVEEPVPDPSWIERDWSPPVL